MERPRLPARRPITMALGVVIGLTACGAHPGQHALADAGPPEFVAVQGDFADYSSWESFDGGTQPPDNLTVVGQRTLYLNHRPPNGHRQFPEGTIIVKTTAGAQTFAMVKRGGDFNLEGALGWEWFELADAPTGEVQIVWRGTGPPIVIDYGTPNSISCNQCHVDTAFFNDSVAGPALQLADF